MLKRIVASAQPSTAPLGDDWLPLEEIAEVEVTSENAAHPIEAALLNGRSGGWKAEGPGKQTIRLVFAEPQPVKRIWLNFVEPTVERTQEYVVRWSSDRGRSFRDVVRQQWNFSPSGSSSEIEDHRVELRDVTILELTITPDTSGGAAVASLAQLRLA